jgi:DNA modification methylase
VTVVHGDCLTVMRTMEPESVDAIVCDPPYGLAFMGKNWDHGIPGVPFWTEALRVAKPGAHLLAFGGTRTFHRLACAIEDAGWEIRDTLSWIYGSGFPKSLDVGKAMDRIAPRVGMFTAFAAHLASRRQASGLSRREVGQAVLGNYKNIESATANVSNWERAVNVPSLADFVVLKPMLGLSDEWTLLIERVEAEREVLATRRDGGKRQIAILGTEAQDYDVTSPATDLAKQWDGWGTALKPGWEPIILARKPLSGTVAGNVTQWGTGALNVDGCRIAGEPWKPKAAETCGPSVMMHDGSYQSPSRANIMYREKPEREGHQAGRWPANVVLDEEAARMLDEQSGERPSTLTGRSSEKDYTSDVVTNDGLFGRRQQGQLYADRGGASRFFYTAKASRAEREMGLDGMPRQKSSKMGDGIVSCVGHPNPNAKGTTESGDRRSSNHHPTVKPLALMRWLCRLVTPPNGLILDPFCGSGSTGCAAALEGFRFVGIEQDAEYCAIAEKRIAHWAKQVQPELNLSA